MAFNGPTHPPDVLPVPAHRRGRAGVVRQGASGPAAVPGPARQRRPSRSPPRKVLLPPTGGYWADLYDLKISPVMFDREFLAALPRGLRSACLGLEPQGPIAIHAKRLVIDDQPKGQPPTRRVPAGRRRDGSTARAVMPAPTRATLPTIYWDGTVTFRDATMKTGVSWEGVTGQFSSRGLYLGDQLGRVVGNLAVDKGRVLKQPVETLSARFEVDPAQPDVIGIPWINGRALRRRGRRRGPAGTRHAGPVRPVAQRVATQAGGVRPRQQPRAEDGARRAGDRPAQPVEPDRPGDARSRSCKAAAASTCRTARCSTCRSCST